MHYLIDGHNLIAYLPDIDLADPDDEVKLVLKLRQFATRTRQKVTVIFDGGLPGGVSQTLSTSSVKVQFASAAGMSADQVLLSAIRKTKNVNTISLVTSDREIKAVAVQKRIATMTADAFIRLMQPSQKSAMPDDVKEENPRLSAAEVKEWLRLFGEDS